MNNGFNVHIHNMNCQQTNTISSGKPYINKKRSKKNRNFVSKHSKNDIIPKPLHNIRDGVMYPSGRHVYVPPSSKVNSPNSHNNPTPIFHEKMNTENVNIVEMEAQMSSVTLNEESVVNTPVLSSREKISEGVITPEMRQTINHLLNTFRMSDIWTNGQHMSPDMHHDVYVDLYGCMHFLIEDKDRYDIGIPLLLGILTRIHLVCMMFRTRMMPVSGDNPKNISNRCLGVDPYEVSWSIQIHLFKMYKIGYRCIEMNPNNTLSINKNSLLSMIRDSLTLTYMTKENALWAFNTIAIVIAKDW